MNPESLLEHFAYEHLQDPTLRTTAAMYYRLAMALCDGLKASDERTSALRHLLASREAAVRAAVDDLAPTPVATL